MVWRRDTTSRGQRVERVEAGSSTEAARQQEAFRRSLYARVTRDNRSDVKHAIMDAFALEKRKINQANEILDQAVTDLGKNFVEARTIIRTTTVEIGRKSEDTENLARQLTNLTELRRNHERLARKIASQRDTLTNVQGPLRRLYWRMHDVIGVKFSDTSFWQQNAIEKSIERAEEGVGRIGPSIRRANREMREMDQARRRITNYILPPHYDDVEGLPSYRNINRNFS